MNLNIIHRRLAKDNGMPENFHFYAWEAFPKCRGEMLYFEVRGGCCPLVLSGKRKGKPNYRKEDKATRRMFTVLTTEANQWLADYEAETGNCHRCEGSKQEIASVGVGGTTWRECGRCKGTGKRNQ